MYGNWDGVRVDGGGSGKTSTAIIFLPVYPVCSISHAPKNLIQAPGTSSSPLFTSLGADRPLDVHYKGLGDISRQNILLSSEGRTWTPKVSRIAAQDQHMVVSLGRTPIDPKIL